MCCTCVCVYGGTRDTGIGGYVWRKSVLFDDLMMLYLCRSVDYLYTVRMDMDGYEAGSGGGGR